MLTREQKREQFEELRETLASAHTMFVLENKGLSVNEVNQLRSQIRKADGSYRVIKNSVVRLAIDETAMQPLSEHLSGPNAYAFTGADSVELAKVLRDFIKQHPSLAFKKLYLEGSVLPAEEAEKLADLPSKEELISRLLYLLQSPMRRLAVALNSPLQGLAVALSQIAKQQETES